MTNRQFYKKYYNMLKDIIPVEFNNSYYNSIIEYDINWSHGMATSYDITGFKFDNRRAPVLIFMLPTVKITMNHNIKLSILSDIEFKELSELDEFITSGKILNMYKLAVEYYGKFSMMYNNLDTETNLLKL